MTASRKVTHDFFNLSVKTRRHDLFDRSAELRNLERKFESDPLSVVLGIRRLGKSSLVAVSLQESKLPNIAIDLRGVGPNPSPVKVLERFETGINTMRSKKLWDSLSQISGVSLFSFGIQFSKSNKSRPQLQTIFDSIQDYARERGTRFILALDEVQEARGLSELTGALAHAYDYDKDLHIVLAGSEIGVLQDFIGIDNPDSHLYGRRLDYVELQKFPRELSIEFLEAGCKAYGLKSDRFPIEEVVNKLDGIVGWLVLYGYEVISTGKSVDLNRVVDQAVKLVEAETSRLIAKSKHYRSILKALSSAPRGWKSIFDFVLAEEGHVSESVFNDSLSYLVKYGMVKRNNSEYEIPDPITAEYARRL